MYIDVQWGFQLPLGWWQAKVVHVMYVSTYARDRELREELTTRYLTRCGRREACSFVDIYNARKSFSAMMLYPRFLRLTRKLNVALHPPSICLLTSHVADLACRLEWKTFVMMPPCSPSHSSPFGIWDTWSSHRASSVAVCDWRGTRRWSVRKERNNSHASSDP